MTGPGSSRALVTFGTGPAGELLDVTLPGFQDFAARHGYDLVVGSGDSGGRPPAWGKVRLLQQVLRSYDEAVWIDADVLIVDGSSDLPSLPHEAFQGLVEQRSGGTLINTGVWQIRAGTDADAFLSLVWAQDSRVNHQWWEQAAVLDLLGYVRLPGDDDAIEPTGRGAMTTWFAKTSLLDSTWNALYHPLLRDSDTPRFWHFAGMSQHERLYYMAVESRRHAQGIELLHRKILTARYRLREKLARP